MNNNDYQNKFYNIKLELLSKFERSRLEEKGFPVYFHKFPPALYLAWSRIFTAQKLLLNVKGRTALDYGSGLGVMLPFLRKQYDEVFATDEDLEITKFVTQGLGLNAVKFLERVLSDGYKNYFDVIVALDVLEHVEDLAQVYALFMSITAKNGIWIISGPTENFLYKGARKLAGTSGKGHVRNIYDVFREIPGNVVCEKIYTLPWGIPLFLVGKFRNLY